MIFLFLAPGPEETTPVGGQRTQPNNQEESTKDVGASETTPGAGQEEATTAGVPGVATTAGGPGEITPGEGESSPPMISTGRINTNQLGIVGTK